MSMDGKRFGAGIAGGLVLALLIVGSTGSASGLFTSLTPSSPTQNVGGTTMAATTATSTMTSSTPGGAFTTAGKNTTSPGPNSTLAIVNSQQNPEPWYGVFLVSDAAGSYQTPNAAHQAPSRLPNLAAQPALQSGIVLLPLLGAVILGALLFRASAKGRSAEAEPKVD